jgi:hypothetical protein
VLAASIIRVMVVITLMMEAGSTSEMLIHFHQTTQCYNPEHSCLHHCFCLKEKVSHEWGFALKGILNLFFQLFFSL